MHHWDGRERQLVRAKLERLAVLDLLRAGALAVELFDKVERLLVGDDRDIGIHLAQHTDGAGMVGLDVVDDEIIDRTAAQDALDALQILAEELGLDAVDQRDFLVVDQVRIVGNAVGQRPQVLKQVRLAVVDAHPPDVLSDRNSL